VQILFAHPEYWDRLTSDEHALLHDLPVPHGTLVAWLERNQVEHGLQPWAVLAHALAEDASLDEAARRLADGDADPEATFEDLQRVVDRLMSRLLKAEMNRLAPAASDPEAGRRYRAVFAHWQELEARAVPSPDGESSAPGP
jgi:DNA primase